MTPSDSDGKTDAPRSSSPTAVSAHPTISLCHADLAPATVTDQDIVKMLGNPNPLV